MMSNYPNSRKYLFQRETIVERRDPPVAIVHDLFVLCAFHKPNVIGIDLQQRMQKTSIKINLGLKYFIINQFGCLSECHITFIFAFDLTSNQYFQKLTLIYKKHLVCHKKLPKSNLCTTKTIRTYFPYITSSKVNRIFLPKLCNSNKQLGWVKFPFLLHSKVNSVLTYFIMFLTTF